MTKAIIEVTVCICTFRRSSLRTAMWSVVGQILPPEMSLKILVVDNDIEPTARNIVQDFLGAAGVRVEYRHAPAQNISIARNAALDAAAKAPWLAFIDDDERASPDWLGKLMDARVGAQAVFGPCVAVYDENVPTWMTRADFHSNRITKQEGAIDTGYTANVLIDMSFVQRHGIRFELELGTSGGEDTMFFHKMHRLGGILKYAPQAVVYEDVVASRAKLKWIATRRFRAGQTFAMVMLTFVPRRYRLAAWTSPLKIAACAIISAFTVFDTRRAAWWLMRGVFHIGVLSYALGLSIHQEYNTPSSTALAD
jgi:succinoglycan biosynthesis protein ExoM